jgi:hypothetical protein
MVKAAFERLFIFVVPAKAETQALIGIARFARDFINRPGFPLSRE